MAIVGLTNLFAIMATGDDPRLAAAINAKFPEDHMKLGVGQWLVASTGTSKDVSDSLGITTGGAGSAVIVSFSGYYGRAPTNVWEWIAARMGKPRSA